jgi:predicted nucleic acid-binding protein
MPRLYLDTCCLNRPFDDQSQERVRAETAAIRLILEEVELGNWELIRSEAVEVELRRILDPGRRFEVLTIARAGTIRVSMHAEHRARARVLKAMGFKGFDALHIAFAESAGADVLLTTDDAMVRRSRRLSRELAVPVTNPLTWLQETSWR